MLKKIRLLIYLILTIFLFVFEFPVFVFSASNNPGTLTVKKSNGQLASEGADIVSNDYYWEYDSINDLHKLHITSENLTVSGTDNSNNVWIIFDRSNFNDLNDDACASITFNNLNLEGNVSFVVQGLATMLTIKGNNSITNNVDNSNTFFTNCVINIIGDGDLSINSSGNNSSGIYNTDEDNDIILDLYGELNINSTCYGVYSKGNIVIKNNTKKITIRSGDGLSTFPLFGGIEIESDIKTYGSSDINADETNMQEAIIKHYGDPQVVAIDDGEILYPCSIVCKPKETLKTIEFNLMEHKNIQIGPIRVEEGEKIVKPEDPFVENHVFNGWYKEISRANEWNFDNDIVTGSMTLYAKWNFMMTGDLNQSINVDSNNDNLVFVSSADNNNFNAVFIDNERVVETRDYLREEGSTKIILLSSYLKTLCEGQHTIEIESKINFDEEGGCDFETAIDTFTIIKNKPSERPNKYTVPNTGVFTKNN